MSIPDDPCFLGNAPFMLTGQSVTATNALVGKRMREARREARLAVGAVGLRLKLTAQHISRLETGRSQITIGHLWRLSQVLGKPMAWFFEEVPRRQLPEGRNDRHHEFLEAAAVLAPAALKSVCDMVRALAEAPKA